MLLFLQEFVYPDARDRQFLLFFHKFSKRKSLDVRRYNDIKNSIAKIEEDLKVLRSPLFLHLPEAARMELLGNSERQEDKKWVNHERSLEGPVVEEVRCQCDYSFFFFFCPHSPGWNNLLRSRRDNNNDWLLNIFIILSSNFPEGVVRQDSKQLFLQRVKCHAWQAFDRERVFWVRGRREGSYPSPFSLARGLAPKFPSTFERLPRRYRLHVYFARFFTVDQSPNYLLCDMIIVKQFRYFVQYISCGVSIQVKAFKQCFPVVVFIMLYFELIEGPVRNKKNFVCFAKKSVNRKPFLVRTIFPPTKIFSAVIKVQSCRREDLEAYNFLSGDKNPLFLDSYPSSGHSKRWWK